MITRKAEYAIAALVELARQEKGSKTTTAAIAREQNIPGNLVVQLMGILRQAGWITSSRGPAGGVELSRSPEDITLRDVIELIDGPVTITRCLMENKPCQNKEECPLRQVWSEAQEKMLSVLEQVTIKQLAERFNAVSKQEPGAVQSQSLN
ncbi:MAG: Rrf2 family transcriptional regulator [Dethiobacteria bacterium]|nr:Rrf2 family transcriptional regulator [Bacillota bacterium]HOP69057.1 Rrf2 family transcriptional regulator [Bacillota bacterium]HPT33689.1 Rrf2 family transcriptional regulator [Bacillota bacterium]HPZ65568.1 Rrf2 family transcriptional regulator [Bacillota bacterium]HQD06897.1 Rrf2 family transcriptional regulator [Bacillota bacterium]